MINWILLIIGSILILISVVGCFKPKKYLEWLERKLVFHRVRIITGLLLIILGGTITVFLLKTLSIRDYLLSGLAIIIIIYGSLIILFQDLIRKELIIFGEMKDVLLKILFIISSVIGIGLILFAIFH